MGSNKNSYFTMPCISHLNLQWYHTEPSPESIQLGLDNLKNWQKLYWFIAFLFQFGGAWSFVWRG